MREDDLGSFNSEWDHMSRKMGFYKDFGKMLGYDGGKVSTNH